MRSDPYRVHLRKLLRKVRRRWREAGLLCQLNEQGASTALPNSAPGQCGCHIDRLERFDSEARRPFGFWCLRRWHSRPNGTDALAARLPMAEHTVPRRFARTDERPPRSSVPIVVGPTLCRRPPYSRPTPIHASLRVPWAGALPRPRLLDLSGAAPSRLGVRLRPALLLHRATVRRPLALADFTLCDTFARSGLPFGASSSIRLAPNRPSHSAASADTVIGVYANARGEMIGGLGALSSIRVHGAGSGDARFIPASLSLGYASPAEPASSALSPRALPPAGCGHQPLGRPVSLARQRTVDP